MNQAAKLLQAELLGRLRDRSFWLEAFLLPLLVSCILGLSLGQVGRGKIPVIHVGVLAGTPDHLVVQVLGAAYQAAGSIEMRVYDDPDEARRRLRAGNLDALAVLHPFDPAADPESWRLDAVVESGQTTMFQATLVAQITEATLRTLAAELAARRAVALLLAEAGTDPSPAWNTPSPVPVGGRLEEVSLARFDLLGAQFAGLAIFFSLLSAFRMMASVFHPHRRGLNLRLSAMPLRPAWVAVGHVGAVALVASLQTLAVLALGRFAFGVRWGEPWLLVAAALLGALAAAAFALALAVLPLGPAARNLVGMLAVLGGSVLGGALMPLEGATPLLQFFARGTLQYWVTGLFTGLSRGVPLSEVAAMFAGVAVYGAAALLLASLLLLRRRPFNA